LGSAGYDVIGDLAELAPGAPEATWYDPDDAPASDQVDVLLDVAETLLREVSALIDRHRHELDAARKPGPWMRLKQKVVARAGDSRPLGVAYGVYRTLRRR